MLTEKEMQEEIRSRVKSLGSQKKAAEEWNFSQQYISDIVKGKPPSPRLVDVVGYERIVLYRKKENT